MKKETKQLILPIDNPVIMTVQGMKFGDPFRLAGNPDLHIRVKPVNFLLNSNLVNDCINRHKCFVVNLEKGTLFVVQGDRCVQDVNVSLLER